MFVADLLEDSRSVVAILPGRFHPFHKGHAYMYKTLVSQYGRDRVWIATSNKVDPPKSPFSFSDKLAMMQLAGIPADRVVETRNMYSVPELTSNFQDDSTIVIFAVSDKDMAEDPRFSFGPKKDGSSSYLQPLPDELAQTDTMDKHGYVSAIKTLDFSVLGQPMRSATEIRNLYATLDDEKRKELIKDLFGNYNNEVKAILDAKLEAPVVTTESTRLAEMGGVGVVANNAKQAKDPRYVTSMTKDVNPGESQRQAAKLGFKLDKKGLPPMVNQQIKTITMIGEQLHQIDREDPMHKSQVLVQGVGVYSISSLHKNLAGKFLELADRMKAMNSMDAEAANYLLQKSPLRVMLIALTDAYVELEKIRSRGGKNSRGISK